MARWIEVDDVAGLPPRVRLQAGDALFLSASGAGAPGSDVVEILGPFTEGTLVADGVLSAMGAPGRVLIVARRPGQAVLEIILGHPFGESRSRALSIDVEESAPPKPAPNAHIKERVRRHISVQEYVSPGSTLRDIVRRPK